MPVAELGPRLQSNPFAAAASLDSRRFGLRNSFAAAARQCASASDLCLCLGLSLAARLFCPVAPAPASARASAPNLPFRPSFSAALAAPQSLLPHTFPPLRLSVGTSLARSLTACLSEWVTASRTRLAAAAAAATRLSALAIWLWLRTLVAPRFYAGFAFDLALHLHRLPTPLAFSEPITPTPASCLASLHRSPLRLRSLHTHLFAASNAHLLILTQHAVSHPPTCAPS